MIAAKARNRDGVRWEAWLGVSLEHIRPDVEVMGSCDPDTLHEIPFSEVSDAGPFARASEVVGSIERQYGERVRLIPGTTAFYLGSLTGRDAHREQA